MKEQIQQLKKRPSLTIETGKLSSGVTATPTMPFVNKVQKSKSKGQLLSEALGVIIPEATKIVAIEQDKTKKREAIFEKVQGNSDSARDFKAIRDEAELLDPAQRELFIVNKAQEKLKALKDRGGSISDSYLASYADGFTTLGDNYISANNKTLIKMTDEVIDRQVFNTNQIDFFKGNSVSNLIETTMTVKNIGRGEAGTIVFDNITSTILERVQSDPSYDPTADIERLKQGSDDGMIRSYASHPTYGKTIDTLEKNVSTIFKSRATATEEANKKFAKTMTNNLLSVTFNPKATAEDIAKANSEIEKNKDMFTVEQYSKVKKAVNNRLETQGYATSSNPTIVVALKSKIKTGQIDQDTLEIFRDKLTKQEYLSLSNDVLASETENENFVISSLKEGIKDLEITGTKMLDKSTAFEIDDEGSQRANSFKTMWNSYLINYRDKEGRPSLPSYEEAVKKQQELIKLIQNDTATVIPPTNPTTEDNKSKEFDKASFLRTATPTEIKEALSQKLITLDDLQ